jgi:hypothetical protein
MNTKAILIVLFLSLPVSAISLTVTKSSLFERLREWALERNKWLGKLVSCPYCMSHWVSFALVAWYQPRVVQSGAWPVDLIISAFAIVAICQPVSFAVLHSFKNMEPPMEDPEKEQLRAALQKARELLVQKSSRA